MSMTCGGCNEEIKRNKPWIKCPKCKNTFHQICVNYSSCKPLPSSKIPESWICPDCSVKSRRGGDNSSTPIKPALDVFSSLDIGNEPSPSAPIADAQLMMLQDNIVSALMKQLPAMILKQMTSVISPLDERLRELQNSVSFLADKYDDFSTKIEKLTADSQQQNEIVMQNQEKITRLTYTIRILEQQLRECNVEIHGVNEFKSENLVDLMKQIGNVVSFKLDDSDLMKVTRVAKVNKDSNKPRSIIVKLPSARRRDEFLSAISRYNKLNPQNKLNTGIVGVRGDRSPIFIAEHLSPTNKALHAAARIKAKEKKYKFVWIRDGHIYVRKDENSRYILIKSMESLDKII